MNGWTVRARPVRTAVAAGGALLTLAACAARRGESAAPAPRPTAARSARACGAFNDSVHVGYGAQRACNLTTAVGTVIVDEPAAQQSGTIADVLRSRVPGLDVRAINGLIQVRIRGAGWVNGGGEPLVVIDGMPVGGSSGAALAALVPSDVARVDVLKDAGAAAVYGSRAANGVLLVTTRRR